MPQSTPKHWGSSSLEELTTKIGSGATPKGGKNAYKSTGTPLIRSMNVHFNGFVDSGLAYLDEDQAEKLKSVTVVEDDVLLNITGASIGRVTTAPTEMDGARVNQHVSIIRSNGGFQPRFLSHYLASPEMQREIMETQSGATRQALTKGKIGNFQIPLPPLNEQRRIADKIDALQVKSHRAREALETVGPLLEKFRQSVLAAAFRGDLTAEWRKQHPDVEPVEKLLERIRAERRVRWEKAELAKMRAKGKEPKNDKWKAKYTEPEPVDATGLPELPEGWCWANVDELAEVIRGASPRPAGDPKYFGGDIPWITVGEITKDNNVHLEGVAAYLTEEGKNKSRFINKGTLLLTNSGATLGVPKVTNISGCINDGSVAILITDNDVKYYLYHYLTSLTTWLRGLNQGAAQPNLNTGIVKGIAVPVPPIAEICDLKGKIGECIRIVEALTCKAVPLRGLINTLNQSILAKAFRGELVPQDPNDEPASVLLERIRAERGAATGRKKTRRKP